MVEITIRAVTAADAGQLRAIGIQTFTETFAAENTAENMSRYLAEGFSKEKIVAELANAESAFYLASAGDAVVGYLKINFGTAQTELKDPSALEIERIYVLKEFHGAGVGQMLYKQALAVAKERRSSYIWLGVWERNPRAINFYGKNGFVEFDKHVFLLGEDKQTDIMMKLQF